MADWNGQLFMAQRQLVEVIEKNAQRRQIVEQLHIQGADISQSTYLIRILQRSTCDAHSASATGRTRTNKHVSGSGSFNRPQTWRLFRCTRGQGSRNCLKESGNLVRLVFRFFFDHLRGAP